MSASNIKSYKLDLSLSGELLSGLIAQGFEITKPPYTLYSGRKSGITCTLYTSGKLVVQGKEIGPFIEFFLEPEILKDFSFTHPTSGLDLKSRIGVDEAGKGDFFGPLTVGAVYATEKEILKMAEMGVKDSKAMQDSTVQRLAKEIKALCLTHIVVINPAKYNEIYPKFRNLNSLLAWGHATAIESLVEESGCREAIIDQFANERVVIDALKRKRVELNLTQRTKGEEDIVVAAASILARDAFLFGLEKLSRMVDSPLPKGASPKVVQAGKELYERLGEEGLLKVAKRHFKTWEQVCSTRY